MKISLNWAQQYSNVDLKSLPMDELLQKIGSQLGEVESIEQFGPRYNDMFVVRVVSCEKHPNADKLNVCKIDDGSKAQNVNRDEDGLVQVVCGAPNVREGMLAVWLPPGVTVPSTTDKDPFVLEARELRGETSNGMLASAHELGISNDHEGIVEVKAEDVGEELTQPGVELKRLYGLDDVVIDIENKMFTHRPDCFGILGVARELAGITGQSFKSPDWYHQKPQFSEVDRLPVKITNDIPALVPRLMAVVIDGIKIGPSPVWMQAGLTRVGTKPINNIVDITNWIMHLTAQPLHAFDYDKIKNLSGEAPTLGPRMAEDGEKLTLLGGKQLTLTGADVVLATDKQAADLAGVMGGAETEVDASTTTILLTCASFDMYTIRRTAMRQGVFTDAVTRYTKGQSPLQNDRALAQAMELVSRHAGGQQASNVYDVHGELPEPTGVTVTANFINDRLGSDLNVQAMKQLLDSVEFGVEVNDQTLQITPPFWRTDIALPEDVVEEIGRLSGYDKLAAKLPARSAMPASEDPLLRFKARIREILSRAGANEVLGYSFVHKQLLESVGQDSELAFHLSNALSPELQVYRLSLTPSLLEKVHANIKAGFEEFVLFELGKTHIKGFNDTEDKDLPAESNLLSLVFAASDKVAKEHYGGEPYYQAAYYADYLLGQLDSSVTKVALTDYQPKGDAEKQLLAPFEPLHSAVVLSTRSEHPGRFIGVIGEFKETVRKKLKLPALAAGFELDVEWLSRLDQPSTYQPLSRFPASEQDLCLEVPSSTSYTAVTELISKTLAKGSDLRVKLRPADIYAPENSDVKRVTVRISLQHMQRTLTTEYVNSLLDDVAKAAVDALQAKRI